MDFLLRIDVNIIAFLLLAGVVVIAHHSLYKRDRLIRFFIPVSYIVLLQLFFETASCLINKHPDTHWIVLSYVFHFSLFITAPILTFFWLIFVKRIILPKGRISRTEFGLLSIPVMINIFLVGLSPAYGFLFTISPENIYQRGYLFILSSAITYLYLIIGFVLTVKNRRKVYTLNFAPFLLAAILPIIGGVLQTLFYGLLLMWSMTAFALVFIFILIQVRCVHLDTLTGAWSRASVEQYLFTRIRKSVSEKFGMIIFDLDGLKNINDCYGHFEGDKAIQTCVVLVKKHLKESDILARYGGDEFLIILEAQSLDELSDTTKRIRIAFDNFNKENLLPYKVGCCFGYDMFDQKKYNIPEFLHHIDGLMYQNKAKAKQERQ
jgi:diguanylate cyclase (GGDEF)-like protein